MQDFAAQTPRGSATISVIGPRLHVRARCAKQCAPPILNGGVTIHSWGRSMAGTVEQKLAAQGVVLPEPRAAVANYVGFVPTGSRLFVSGQRRRRAHAKLIRQ